MSIIDIHDPTNPRIIANLPLMNSIMGPPVNLAITPDQHLADSLDWVKDGEGWKGVPDNKIYVIDLITSPPVQIATVEAGKQPSGMAINRAGTLALVPNRADDTVGVFRAGLPGSEAVAQSDRQKLPARIWGPSLPDAISER